MKPFLTLALLLPLTATPLRAADPPDPDTRLREALKNATQQLRSSQAEIANLQIAKALAEQKNTELSAKLAELEKRQAEVVRQANSDKATAEKTIAGLNNRLAEREQRLADYIAALDKWKAGFQQAAEAARTQDAQRARLAEENTDLQRTVADRERKNLALFATALEILDRYEGYALGKSLAAREPFIGTTRVKIENLVQGYKDRIVAQRLTAPATPATSAKTSSSNKTMPSQPTTKP